MTGTQTMLLAGLLATGLLLGCSDGDSSPKKTYSQNKTTGLAKLANATDPGIEFTKTTVGLQSRTLDFIGSPPLGLTGAKAANLLFFAADEDGSSVIYSRNLDTLERTQITTVKSLAGGSLSSNSNGRYLLYCKSRFLDRYIDNPDIKYPEVIALPYLFDTQTGEETELIDFRDKDWLPYRTSASTWSISPDGNRVCFVSYNLDRIMLDSQLKEWLYYADAYNNPPPEFTEQEISDLETMLRGLLSDTRLSPLLKEQGIDPFAKGPITADDQAAVTNLQQLMSIPEPVLLVYENGIPSRVPITVQEGFEHHLHSIIGMGNDRLILGVQQSGSDPTDPQQIFELDTATGVTSLVGSFTGVPSTMGLDSAQEFFLMALNPMDEETKLLDLQTNLVKFPLNGGDTVSIELPGDFFGNVDMSTDGKFLIAQELSTNDLFFIDSEQSSKVLLSKLVGPLDAVFCNDAGTTAGVLDTGIIGLIPVMESPQDAEGWVEQEYFAKYETLVRDFISNAGYVFPKDAIFEWEQREGLGAHEAACSVSTPGEIGASFLTRYSLDLESFVSVWCPTGNRLARINPSDTSNLDFYDCQQIAEDMLANVGWMNPETWQYYQPGSNPLYDERTQSFIIIYRDGYFLDNSGQWVTNVEATLRVGAVNGAVEEMSLSVLEEIHGQALEVSPDRAAFMIRNQEDFAIPVDAPLELDTENHRLVIGTKRQTSWGPAEYNPAATPRLCYEIDGFLQPENELILTAIVDVSNGEVLGQINFMPTGVKDRPSSGPGT